MANHSPSCSFSYSSPSPSPSPPSSPATHIIKPSGNIGSKAQTGKLNRVRHHSIHLSHDIPILARSHCTQFGEPGLRGKLQSLFEHELAADMVQSSFFASAHTTQTRAISRISNDNVQNDCIGGVCLSDCSSKDGDDTSRELRVLKLTSRRGERPPCSSPSIYELPINVTRVASECSSDGEANKLVLLKRASIDRENSNAEDWKLHAEVLMAECNLLRVEKELAIRRWKYSCTKAGTKLPSVPVKTEEEESSEGAEHPRSPMHQPSDQLLEDEIDAEDYSRLYANGNFAREALRRLQDLSNASCNCRIPNDPTDALQERLRKLLLAASGPETGGRWTTMEHGAIASLTNDNCDEKRCLIETAALRKQLDILSSELSETKAAAEFIRREYRSMLSEETSPFEHLHLDQAMANGTSCKAAIQKIAAQMRAETEQWCQMQGILHSLKEEMEALHKACEMWEERALCAEAQVLSLRETAYELRNRAEKAEEDASFLEAERHILKNKIKKMKGKLAKESSQWVENEAIEVHAHAGEYSKSILHDEEKKHWHATAGAQENHMLYESMVHSRNDSSRSSVDMESGILNQKCTSNKSSKKSLAFTVKGSNDGIAAKLRPKSLSLGHQLLKAEAMNIDSCSSINGLKSSMTRRKLGCPRPKSIEAIPNIGDYMEGKKVQHFTGVKENSMNVGDSGSANQLQDGKRVTAAKQEHSGPLSTLRSSRSPFGDILNALIPKQGHPLSSIVH